MPRPVLPSRRPSWTTTVTAVSCRRCHDGDPYGPGRRYRCSWWGHVQTDSITVAAGDAVAAAVGYRCSHKGHCAHISLSPATAWVAVATAANTWGTIVPAVTAQAAAGAADVTETISVTTDDAAVVTDADDSTIANIAVTAITVFSVVPASTAAIAGVGAAAVTRASPSPMMMLPPDHGQPRS